MPAEATRCVAKLTQVVSIAVGGMSRTADNCVELFRFLSKQEWAD